MTLPIYQIDAFTGQLFAGNPAAVVTLDVGGRVLMSGRCVEYLRGEIRVPAA